jgi:hypothetical protein
MVEVITNPTEVLLAVPEIYATSVSHPNLTPRTLDQLKAIASRGDIVLIKANEDLIGWGIREVLTKNLKEVGLMFIKPEFRTASAFAALARGLAADSGGLVLASYDPSLIRHAVLEFGFREANLIQVIIKSRGRFLAKRLSKDSRRAVAGHLKSSKPLFAIRGKK